MKKNRIDLQRAYVFMPWLAAGDLLSLREQNRIAAVKTEVEMKNLIATDLPEYFQEQEFSIDEILNGKLAFQVLLTVTDPNISMDMVNSWPSWTFHYRKFSWFSFFQSWLVPFTFPSDKGFIFVREIWNFCFPNESYRLDNIEQFEPTNLPL